MSASQGQRLGSDLLPDVRSQGGGGDQVDGSADEFAEAMFQGAEFHHSPSCWFSSRAMGHAPSVQLEMTVYVKSCRGSCRLTMDTPAS